MKQIHNLLKNVLRQLAKSQSDIKKVLKNVWELSPKKSKK